MMVVMTDKQPSKRKGRAAIIKPELTIQEQIELANRLAAALQEMATTTIDLEVQDFFVTQKTVKTVNHEIEKLRFKKEKALQEATSAKLVLARKLKDFHESGIPARSIADHFNLEQHLVETLIRVKSDEENINSDNLDDITSESISDIDYLTNEVVNDTTEGVGYYG
jgi:hypothetical protein